jgi:hypothetical protein
MKVTLLARSMTASLVSRFHSQQISLCQGALASPRGPDPRRCPPSRDFVGLRSFGAFPVVIGVSHPHLREEPVCVIAHRAGANVLHWLPDSLVSQSG